LSDKGCSDDSVEILANNGALLRARLPIATKKPENLHRAIIWNDQNNFPEACHLGGVRSLWSAAGSIPRYWGNGGGFLVKDYPSGNFMKALIITHLTAVSIVVS